MVSHSPVRSSQCLSAVSDDRQKAPQAGARHSSQDLRLRVTCGRVTRYRLPFHQRDGAANGSGDSLRSHIRFRTPGTGIHPVAWHCQPVNEVPACGDTAGEKPEAGLEFTCPVGVGSLYSALEFLVKFRRLRWRQCGLVESLRRVASPFDVDSGESRHSSRSSTA